MKKSLLLVSLLALSSLSSTAFAGDFFVRGEFGRSDVELEIPGVVSDHDKGPAYSLRGGYWFNQNLAVETSYSRLYDEDFNDGTNYGNTKLTTIGFGMVAKEHFSEARTGFFVQLRGGFAHERMSVDSNLGNESDKQTKPYYGIGAGYDFNKHVGLSLNFDHNEAAIGNGIDLNADTISLGVEARF